MFEDLGILGATAAEEAKNAKGTAELAEASAPAAMEQTQAPYRVDMALAVHIWPAVQSHRLVRHAFTYIGCTGSARHALRSGMHPKGKGAQAGWTCD